MNLDNLAPELLLLIMRATNSPQQLYRLISASPQCYRVFSRSPELILSSVLKNAIPQDQLCHFIAVLDAPSDISLSRSLRKQKMRSFLERHLNPEAKTTKFPQPNITKAYLIAMCRLHTRVNFFLDDYFRTTMRKFDLEVLGDYTHTSRHPSGADGHQLSSVADVRDLLRLSGSERTRLMRALLRFELYCRAFSSKSRDRLGDSDDSSDSSDSVDFSDYRAFGRDQFDIFLARLTPWEVEEITTIHQYFCNVVGDCIDELEDDFMSAALASPGIQLSSQEPDPQSSGPDGLGSLANLELGPLDMFSLDTRAGLVSVTSNITAFGLGFLYDLYQGDKSQRSQLLRSKHTGRGPFLHDALGMSSRASPTSIRREDTGYDDDPAHANLGYWLFKNPDFDYFYCIQCGGMGRYPLRNLGYIFWDVQRIQRPMFYGKIQDEAHRDGGEYFDRPPRKSAEERLEGVRLPWREIRRLQREFGYKHCDDLYYKYE